MTEDERIEHELKRRINREQHELNIRAQKALVRHQHYRDAAQKVIQILHEHPEQVPAEIEAQIRQAIIPLLVEDAK